VAAVDTSAVEVRILLVAPTSAAEHGILVAAPASAVEVRAFHHLGRVNLK